MHRFFAHYISPLIFLIFYSCLSLQNNNSKKNNTEITPANLEIITHAVQESLVPTVWDTGDTTVSNEDRLDLLIPSVQGIGGAYVGVGSEQNLTIAAWANSQIILLMDFTQIVVRANEITVLFLRNSPKKEDFGFYWSTAGEKLALELIKQNFKDSNTYVKVYKKAGPFIRRRHKTNLMLSARFNYKMFQTDDDLYSRIYNLAIQNKILSIKGNLLGEKTFFGIGSTLKKVDMPLGIIYFSNAEEYFIYPPSFVKSINNLPTTDSSLVVRTISVRKDLLPWSPGSDISTKLGFHYCIQPVNNFKNWLNSNTNQLNSLKMMLKGGEINKTDGFTIVRRNPGL